MWSWTASTGLCWAYFGSVQPSTCFSPSAAGILSTIGIIPLHIPAIQSRSCFCGGAGAGLRYLVGTFAEDYTSFISLFTEFPFCLTRRTGDAYTASQLVSILPTLLVALAGMVRKGRPVPGCAERTAVFVLGMGLCACFPFVRMAAMLGQPDWFGLIFALLILTLTLDYRFDRAEPVRWAMIFLPQPH